MLHDWHIPETVPIPGPPAPATSSAADFQVRQARWTPRNLMTLATTLSRATSVLREVPPRRLLAAWDDTVAAFRDPGSAERRALDPALAAGSRLSPAGLSAALEAVLGGVAGEHAERVFAQADPATADPTPVLVVLSANLPGLAVQPLLPILALGRPAILKSASAEPLFTPTFVGALAKREPAIGRAVAALTWKGGRAELEEPLLAAAGRVLAYGDEAALADLRRRAPAKLIAYGPKTSLAVVGAGSLDDKALAAVAEGLARDIALFDQRGCLSVAAVYTTGDARRLAEALARTLDAAARRWPPGPMTTAEAAAVRQARDEATMHGKLVTTEASPSGGGSSQSLRSADSLAAGTVILGTEELMRPSPGLRTVHVHPLSHPSRLPSLLAPWRDHLQGVALAGFDADTHRRLTAALTDLGVSRFAAPGELQSPDTRWHNGGVDPLLTLT